MALSRRSFLRSLPIAGAGLALAGAGDVPLSASSSLSLGFSLYGMKTLPIERAVAECARIGYRNVELSLLAGFETEAASLTPAVQQRVRDALRRHQLPASALLGNFSLTVGPAEHARNLGLLERAATFARALGELGSPLVQTTAGGTPAEWESQRAVMIQRVREWGRVAAEAGVRLAIKGHALHAINSPRRLLELLEAADHPALCVAYDHCHFALAGVPFAESLPPLLARTRYVHVKDAILQDGKPRFLLPGQGPTDFRELAALLTRLGYRGPVVAEVSAQISGAPGYDPVAAAEHCHRVLSAALQPRTGTVLSPFEPHARPT